MAHIAMPYHHTTHQNEITPKHLTFLPLAWISWRFNINPTMLSLSHWVMQKAATRLGPASIGNTHHLFPATAVAAMTLSPMAPPIQQRFAWTKAKKKRYARYERRTRLAEKGIPLPKPPYYFEPVPVVNAIDRETQKATVEKDDAAVTAELQARIAAQKEKPPVLRYHMTGLKMSDRVRRLFDLNNGNQKEVIAAQKQQGMELFQMREGDTGSTSVQIIALTTRIQSLQMHMKTHRKDKHSKRGMDALFVRRRKLLDYLERTDFNSYRKVVKTLGLTR
jgi:small subunit ribosomal protein S15